MESTKYAVFVYSASDSLISASKRVFKLFSRLDLSLLKTSFAFEFFLCFLSSALSTSLISFSMDLIAGFAVSCLSLSSVLKPG